MCCGAEQSYATFLFRAAESLAAPSGKSGHTYKLPQVLSLESVFVGPDGCKFETEKKMVWCKKEVSLPNLCSMLLIPA